MSHPKHLNRFGEIPVITGPGTCGTATAIYADASQILTKATGFMDGYKYTLNPYSGCGFGCTYCYAAFFARDLRKQDSWGYWVNIKRNALQLLSRHRQKLDDDDGDGARIYMSSVTDPYQPIERELSLTRGILEIMAYGEVRSGERQEPQQGVMFGDPESQPKGHTPKLVVQTRSPLVTRDIDLFQQIKENGGCVQVNMTVTTDDEVVRKQFEPSCPANHRRIATIKQIHEADIQACITLTPLIWANDPETFADQLLQTGIERFIIQPFKFTGGKFVAQTRAGALQLMAQRLGCDQDPKTIERRYMERYREAFRVFQQVLRDVKLGEEKKGFAPPF